MASLDGSYRGSKSRGNTDMGEWKRIGTFPPTFTSLLPPLFDKHNGCYGNDLIDVAEKPKILKRFWQRRSRVIRNNCKKWLWKDWSLPGLITSLRDKRSSWSKSWISVCGHISYGVNKEKHTVHHAEKSVQNFYTVVNTAKYHFFKIWPNQKGTPLSKEKHVSQTDPSRPTPFHLCLLLISPKLLPNSQWHFCSFNLHYGC